MQIGRLFVLIVLTVSAFLKVWKGFRHFYSLLKSQKDWHLLEWIGSRRGIHYEDAGLAAILSAGHGYDGGDRTAARERSTGFLRERASCL